MTSTAAASSSQPSLDAGGPSACIHDSNDDVTDSNNDATGSGIVQSDERQNKSLHKDDPATMAASEELKHTTISDKPQASIEVEEGDVPVTQAETSTKENPTDTAASRTTPEGSSPTSDQVIAARFSSPKKKRGRDQDEEDGQLIGEDRKENGSTIGGVQNGDRADRSEPEKKRHRDTSQEPLLVTEKAKSTDLGVHEKPEVESPTDTPDQAEDALTTSNNEKKPATSASAFASSGFADLAASSTSPFGTLGGNKPSVLGAISSSTSGFGALTGTKTHDKPLGFGSATGEKASSGFGGGFGGATSGFGALGGGNAFGAKLGNGFAGGSGSKLTSFAAAGKNDITKESKHTKAFGAPESDNEEEEDESDEGEGTDEGSGADEDEDTKAQQDDKKKTKPSKVNSGETDEVSLLQMRAKLYTFPAKDIGWKERGVGSLKLNVHKRSVGYYDNGQPIPNSFATSASLDGDPPHTARLVMRQENTHRLILNTPITKALDFKDKPNAQGQIAFLAPDVDSDGKLIQMLFKMSDANAKLFHAQVDMIKGEL